MTNRFHITFNPLYEESMIRFKKQYKIRFFKKLNGDQPGWSIPVEFKDQINELIKGSVKDVEQNIQVAKLDQETPQVVKLDDETPQVAKLFKDQETQVTKLEPETRVIKLFKDQGTQCDWDEVVSNVVVASDHDVLVNDRIYKNDIADEVKEFFKTFLQKDFKI